jgi:hypothetical protein
LATFQGRSYQVSGPFRAYQRGIVVQIDQEHGGTLAPVLTVDHLENPDLTSVSLHRTRLPLQVLEWCLQQVAEAASPDALEQLDTADRFQCPHCGGPMGQFDPEDSCMGARCQSCGVAQAVTTNCRHFRIGEDRTLYAARLEWAGEDRMRTIARLALALGVDARQARALLDTNSLLAEGLPARQVQELSRQFTKHGLRLRIEPDFPWPLPEEPQSPAR